eukprot:227745_1
MTPGVEQICPVDLKSNDRYGESFDLKNDVLVAGARYPLNSQGRADIFRYNKTTKQYDLEQTFIGESNDYLGTSVATTGNVTVISGVWFVKIYRYNTVSNQWELELFLDGNQYGGGSFGCHVYIDADLVVVAARSDNEVEDTSGALHVFRYNNSHWNYEQKIKSNDPQQGEGIVGMVGANLKIYDQNTIVAGSQSFDLNTSYSRFDVGAVYIFRYNETALHWYQQQKIIHPEPIRIGYFGQAVAIIKDVIAIGSQWCSSNGDRGCAWVYKYNETSQNWFLHQKLLATSSFNGQLFGASLAMNKDGSIIVVGSGGGSNKMYTFRYNTSTTFWDSDNMIEGTSMGRFAAIYLAIWKDIIAVSAEGMSYCGVNPESTGGIMLLHGKEFCPTRQPTADPTVAPTQPPSISPSASPTQSSLSPSASPTQPPSISPSFLPTNVPSSAPTLSPSLSPTIAPSFTPSLSPTIAPSITPSLSPTIVPSISPSVSPTNIPTQPPSVSPTQPPSISPTQPPSIAPTQPPSSIPTQPPSVFPTQTPSVSPTQPPTISPTQTPSIAPSQAPSQAPSISPSQTPSIAPTQPPTVSPTQTPSNTPTNPPSTSPTLAPSVFPSLNPSSIPTFAPSLTPTIIPSFSPTTPPTINPSNIPSLSPSFSPSIAPTTCRYYYGHEDLNIENNEVNAVYHFNTQTLINNLTNSIITLPANKILYYGAVSLSGEEIGCDSSITASVCFVECMSEIYCRGMRVIPSSERDEIKELAIICESRSSCQSMKVEIKNVKITKFELICSSGLSCNDVQIVIDSKYEIEIEIHCNDNAGLSCQGMEIILIASGKNN